MSKRGVQHSRRKRRSTLRAEPRRRGRKSTPNRGLGGAQARAKSAAGRAFRGMGRWDGCSVELQIVERAGRRLDKVTSSLQLPTVGTGGGARLSKGRKGSRPTGKIGAESKARFCQAMFALGHGQRVKLVRKLLDGPCTYQSLKHLTKLKPGPLYHHINQLRLAGLIRPRQRDLYELTRAGRNMILGMMVLVPMSRDSRPRPIA